MIEIQGATMDSVVIGEETDRCRVRAASAERCVLLPAMVKCVGIG